MHYPRAALRIGSATEFRGGITGIQTDPYRSLPRPACHFRTRRCADLAHQGALGCTRLSDRIPEILLFDSHYQAATTCQRNRGQTRAAQTTQMIALLRATDGAARLLTFRRAARQETDLGRQSPAVRSGFNDVLGYDPEVQLLRPRLCGGNGTSRLSLWSAHSNIRLQAWGGTMQAI